MATKKIKLSSKPFNTKTIKPYSKKKKIEPKIKVNTKDEYITIYHNDCMADTLSSLEEIIHLANQHKPKDYPTLEYKDISIYLDTDIDYGYYNDVCASVTLEINIKNKDYVKNVK